MRPGRPYGPTTICGSRIWARSARPTSARTTELVRELILGAFEEFTPSFISNAWGHPRSTPAGFAGLAPWQELARELDAAGFDFLFFADALGYPMDDAGAVPEVVIREAVQFPIHDPLALISALAATVDRLGFVVTASTTSEQPYLLARRLATLDHLTDGRVGWNIVTSDNQQALTRLLGMDRITPHDRRYDRADEFIDVALALWEGGWSDDAVRVDKDAHVFSDPAGVHRVQHDGEFFRVDGYFPVTPSIQRTPTLFQAGASSRGRDFAARVAECVFIQERVPSAAAATVRDIRDRVERRGRRRDAVSVINSLSVVVGDTRDEAVERRRELTATPTRDAMAALFLGWSGVDLLGLDRDAPVDELTTDVGRTTLAMYQGQGLTVGEAIDRLADTLSGAKVTGTPDAVAGELIRLAEEEDVDGFLIEHSYGGLETYREFIDRVMPILRERHALPVGPRGGSLRERLTTAATPRLPADHPGASFRRRAG